MFALDHMACENVFWDSGKTFQDLLELCPEGKNIREIVEVLQEFNPEEEVK